MPPAHHPASRPARTAVRSASSPYPSQAAARHDLRASNKARARVVSAAASTSFSPVASSSRQVLGEIDWWTVMAGQLPSNSSRTSFASEVSSLASRRLSSSASSFYAASLIEDYYCADVAMASGNSVIEADAMAEGFAMDIDGQLILAAASTALPSSRASSRPSTPTLFWSSPAASSSISSLPSSPSSSSGGRVSTPSSSVVSSPSTSISSPATSEGLSPRRSFLHRAKSFAGLGARMRGRSASTSSTTSTSSSRVGMGTSTDSKKGIVKLRRL